MELLESSTFLLSFVCIKVCAECTDPSEVEKSRVRCPADGGVSDAFGIVRRNVYTGPSSPPKLSSANVARVLCSLYTNRDRGKIFPMSRVNARRSRVTQKQRRLFAKAICPGFGRPLVSAI